MLASAVIEEIHRMLREGRLSQRGIAQQIGVSRGTVNAIAQGKRRDGPRKHPACEKDFMPPSGLPVRCPGCGAKVQMPCLLCYIRSQAKRRRPAERIRDTNAAGSFD